MEEVKRSESHLKVVVPGDFIDDAIGLTAGHGTFESKDLPQEEEVDESAPSKIYASVAGVVHYIDRYVCVKALRACCYRAEVGDVVVGRVVAVQNKAWTVDINSYQHAQLNLTNINLPGGEQRRRSEEDQQMMRKYLKEGDVISAEVHNVGSQDGRINLQTRNLKYGKLLNGFIFKVDANFVRRGKIHIHDFGAEYGGVGCILGTNGYIWVHPTNPIAFEIKSVDAETREAMSSLRNAIVALEKAQIPIFKDTVYKVLDAQKRYKYSAKDVLQNLGEMTREAKKMIEFEVNLHRPQKNMLSTFEVNEDFIMKE